MKNNEEYLKEMIAGLRRQIGGLVKEDDSKQREIDSLKAMVNNPMQPIIDGRFKENKIVSYCLDNSTDMNDIAMQDFSVEDREQFAQLIGYSHSGYGELRYVTDESYYRAQNPKQCLLEHDKRVIINALESISGTAMYTGDEIKAALRAKLGGK